MWCTLELFRQLHPYISSTLVVEQAKDNFQNRCTRYLVTEAEVKPTRATIEIQGEVDVHKGGVLPKTLKRIK